MLSILKRRLLTYPLGTSFPIPPFCLMVGGVGKSALAGQLAKRPGAHLETTEHLREALCTKYPAKFYPELHAHAYTAWRLLLQNGLRTAKVFQGLQAQACLLEREVQAVVSRVAREGRSPVIEGAHLLLGRFSQVRALQEARERRVRFHHVPIIATNGPGAEEAVLALLKHQSQGGHP
ncbi:2-phosphoglycerate kinase [Meiothermus taiwanensis]|uniref:Uncharacterized protein n=2 Tax=Meiothermus taiwanensis TaxID=172827 RepID=A0A399DWJ4_9DEIN|nr:2-phosphoglycerate kinase [Meiothermus taiwanensis]AWR88084.1 2-phosphoglycerate kinase [Meiothermus taiwanensis WR-220]KIQ53373.1 2-phosphoglycerate kinase [Meiothermus taiwanensis]KZK17012.1 2-phosphoglycerate kinase [Meiothermus taiwanensis]RIH74392.1 hypothetical protein Mcate_02732 [Meiothermus taiwanensis]